MFTSEIQIRVRFVETDQMGVVYHGNYFQYFEVARVEAIRKIGCTYVDIEKEGINMPVVEVKCKFIRPALYDDLITVTVLLQKLPKDHRICFLQEIYNSKKQLLAQAQIELFFLETKTKKRTIMPLMLFEKLQPYFPQAII